MAAASPLRDAEEAFGVKDFARAAPLYEALAGDPGTRTQDRRLAQCRLGVIRGADQDPTEAERLLDGALSGGLAPANQSYCSYAALQVYLRRGSLDKADRLVQGTGDLDLPPTFAARFWALAWNLAGRRGDQPGEVVALQKLHGIFVASGMAYAEVPGMGIRISAAEVNSLLGGGDPGSGVPPARAPFQQSTPSALLDALRGARHDEALRFLNEPDAASQLAARGLILPLGRIQNRIQHLQSEGGGGSLRVGVLLPEGNQYTSHKHKILRGLAAVLADSVPRPVTFTVRSAGKDPAATEAAALDLVLGSHVHAIVGPLLASQAQGAVPLCDLFAVPLLTLGPVAFREDLASAMHVRLGILAASHAAAHLSHVQSLGLSAVSVVYPADPYGVELDRAMEAEAKARGLRVLKRVSYPPQTQQFVEIAGTLLGPQQDKAKSPEALSLIAAAQEKAQKEKRKFDPSQLKLPAVVEFDALYLPDSLPQAKLIATSFAYLDARKLQLLGHMHWAADLGMPSPFVDPYLRGARIPRPAPGSRAGALSRALASPLLSLDMERFAFDGILWLLKLRSRSPSPSAWMTAARSPSFAFDGAGRMGPMDSQGEPRVSLALESYESGHLATALPPWHSRPIQRKK